MTIEDGSVSGADLAGNTLTGTQINESTLAGVLKGNGARTHDYRALSAGSGNQTVVSVTGLGSLAVNCTGERRRPGTRPHVDQPERSQLP